MLSRMKFEIEPLVAEILDQLPTDIWTSKTTTFLDPAIGGGQFVRAIEQRLRSYGHSDNNIRSRVYGFENSNLHIKFAINKYKLVGQYNKKFYEDFLEMNNDMKFDVIVGNPPYVDSSVGKIPLYDKFVEKSTKLSKNTIAYIIPSGFATSDERNGDSVRKLVFNANTKKIKFLEADTFESANVNTLYFIVQKTYTGEVDIASKDKQYTIPYTKGDYIWNDKILLDILTKCKTNRSTQSWIKFNRIEKVSNSKTNKKTVTCISKSEITYEDTKEVDDYINSHKVVTSFLPNAPVHLDVVWYVPKNIAVKKGYTVCSLDSESEAKNLATYLKTSLCRFIHLKTKTSRSLRTPQLKFIPKVDLTKSWTDKELYKHFKLSQEEIDYVESSIK